MMMSSLIAETGADFRTYLENPVFDIDDPTDVEAASKWLAECRAQNTMECEGG
jgi:NDP-sugar pyrophosphorylase family protein